MNKTRWMAGALAVSLCGACAREVRQDDAKLGQLPIDQKQEIFTAQHNVTVAKANRAAAEEARREVRNFVQLADDEYDAARARHEATRRAVDLARRGNDQRALRSAQQQLEAAERQMAAAQAKRDYTRRLADLRAQQVALAQSRIQAAEADLGVIKAQVLQRNNIDPGARMDELQRRRDQATSDVSAAERRVANLRDEVAERRSLWEQRRRDYNVAARNLRDIPLRPPAPPQVIEPEPLEEEGDQGGTPRGGTQGVPPTSGPQGDRMQRGGTQDSGTQGGDPPAAPEAPGPEDNAGESEDSANP